jgi:hypothetical protein
MVEREYTRVEIVLHDTLETDSKNKGAIWKETGGTPRKDWKQVPF